MKTEHLEDSRGEIKRLDYKGRKFNVLYTKKDAIRSGDYHNSKQFDLILKGEFEIWMLIGGKTVKEIKKENDFIIIPENIPHLFISKTDTIMIEWWEKDFEAKYYAPYRKYVEENIKKLEGVSE